MGCSGRAMSENGDKITQLSSHLGLFLNFPLSNLILYSFYTHVLASFVPELEIMEFKGLGWL